MKCALLPFEAVEEQRMALRIGVALSSGGAAGLAHVGVLDELVHAGIEIHCVAGSSAGAMVGAAFAAGRLDEFRERVLARAGRRRLALFDPVWPRSGLLGGRRAVALLGSGASASIEDLPIRYAAVATDLDSGRRVAQCSGAVGDAIRASIAIPGVFAPVCRGGRLLVDGALSDPVPVGAVRELGATFVIASSVIGSAETALTTRCFAAPSPPLHRRIARFLGYGAPTAVAPDKPSDDAGDEMPVAERSDGLAMILCKASNVVQTTIAAARLRDEPPDFLVAPPVYDIGVFEIVRAADAIEAGRAAARAALPELLAAIEHARARSRPTLYWLRRPADADALPAVA
jgi:NTE family protein